MKNNLVHKKPYLFNILFLLLIQCCIYGNTNNLFAQQSEFKGSFNFTSSASVTNQQPFWFVHNQLGKYEQERQYYQLLDFSLVGTKALGNEWVLSGGLNPIIGVSKQVKPQISQLYGKINNNWGSFSIGSEAGQEQFMELASSNGSLSRTLNNRPYPKITFSTNGYLPLWFSKGNFLVSCEYSEAILAGTRKVEGAHLHHKALFFQIRTSSSLNVSFGINHFVFWGGKHIIYGQLPNSLKDYFLYISGSKGNTDFIEGDQLNVAGNQLGEYIIDIKKLYPKGKIKIYVCHPFDDHSGMEYVNWRDNLYGISYFREDQKAFISGFVYEFLYTKHQSGPTGGRGRDNYFNHGVYSSGFTYQGKSMASPLFYPLNMDEDGAIHGFENNRIIAHHVGVEGNLSAHVKWKMLVSYSRNFGTYSIPYNTVKKQLFSYGRLQFNSKNKKSSILVELGIDNGSGTEKKIGGRLGYSFDF